MLVFLNKETAAMMVFQTNPQRIEYDSHFQKKKRIASRNSFQPSQSVENSAT